MAMLSPLTDVHSLSTVGAVFPDTETTDGQIAAAAAAIREAAGQVIAPPATSTISVLGTRDRWLTLPVSPVRSVQSVAIDGSPVADWRLRGGRLWRHSGWACDFGPADVEVTLTHGLDECPPDLLPLIASLVAGQRAAAVDNFDPRRGVASERIDDYQITTRQGENEVLSPVELTERTRLMLAQRFGGGVYVTGSEA